MTLERLIDSAIIVDHLNGIVPATRFIQGLKPQETAISVITRAEILVGVEEMHLRRSGNVSG